MNTNDLRSTAFDVYHYAYPLVTMDITMRQMTNVPDAETELLRAPVNQFAHARTYPTVESKEVVRYNFDTLYSFAWLDLREEPMVLTVPDGAGRYYLMPILDMWTDVFAVPGTRTTAGRAGNIAIAAPDWHGTLPTGVELLRAPTPVVWVMGRTQTNGPADYAAVHAVQDSYRLTPLSAWGSDYTSPKNVPTDPTVDNVTPPLLQVNALTGVELLSRFADLLKDHPPHAHDYPILARMKALGLEPGKDFDPDTLDATTRDAINAAAKEAIADLWQMTVDGSWGTVRNGWSCGYNLGTYGTAYRLRALVAMGGLGANLPEDAVYPSAFVDADGDPCTGEHAYVLRFEKDEIPATDAFWSLTMYDEQGFQIPNELDRFAIGDRDDLAFGTDGSLEIYIQHTNPGPAKAANWLPSPKNSFQVMLRIFSPKPQALRGKFALPPLRKARTASH